MTPKTASAQIKALLDALPEKKTNREKLRDVALVRALLEINEEPLKKARDKEAVSARKKQIIKKALRQFLNDLDRIFDQHEELGDTDVREQVTAAVHRGFVSLRPAYVLPAKFGMFSDTGNQKVRAALAKFLAHPEVVTAVRLLKDPLVRLAAFQDNEVKSTRGNTFFEYFGCTNKPQTA